MNCGVIGFACIPKGCMTRDTVSVPSSTCICTDAAPPISNNAFMMTMIGTYSAKFAESDLVAAAESGDAQAQECVEQTKHTQVARRDHRIVMIVLPISLETAD